MKGVILDCLRDLVTSKFGAEQWDKIIERARQPRAARLLVTADVEDAVALSVVGATCEVLGITAPQAADVFGDYWVNTYAQKLYGGFFRTNRTAKDFLLDMDRVHIAMTKSMANAKPPRFRYEWTDPRTLVMHYQSQRGMIDFVVGLAKGVGRYYREELQVSRLDDERVQVVFPQPVGPAA